MFLKIFGLILYADSFKGDGTDDPYTSLGELISYCELRGLNGHLWHLYLTDRLVNAENIYSLSCEIAGPVTGSIREAALHDMKVMYDLFHTDLRGLLEKNNFGGYAGCIEDYRASGDSLVYESAIREKIEELAVSLAGADDEYDMLDLLTGFYHRFGVGRLGLHRAFRLEADGDGSIRIEPVLKMLKMTLDDLIGYEIPKAKLVDNTEAFLSGRPANNCLLYGDAGTGKSSCIRALATEYYERGLRIIQVSRDMFGSLNGLIALIKNRNYRFIIYMDDLSFEDFETDYKYLKAMIEGGLEQRPDNVLIYATSNRRHLIKETVSDRDDRDEDMHRSDTMAEKLSLSQRFGVSIYFGAPDKKAFDAIVLALARRAGIDMPDDELLLEANKWELSHSGRSGRTARQFVDHLLGQAPGRSV